MECNFSTGTRPTSTIYHCVIMCLNCALTECIDRSLKTTCKWVKKTRLSHYVTLPDSCHWYERPPKSLTNTFHKTRWKFIWIRPCILQATNLVSFVSLQITHNSVKCIMILGSVTLMQGKCSRYLLLWLTYQEPNYKSRYESKACRQHHQWSGTQYSHYHVQSGLFGGPSSCNESYSRGLHQIDIRIVSHKLCDVTITVDRKGNLWNVIHVIKNL